jgi:hypothetical protein
MGPTTAAAAAVVHRNITILPNDAGNVGHQRHVSRHPATVFFVRCPSAIGRHTGSAIERTRRRYVRETEIAAFPQSVERYHGALHHPFATAVDLFARIIKTVFPNSIKGMNSESLNIKWAYFSERTYSRKRSVP